MLAAAGVLSYGLYAWHAVVMTFAPAIAGSFAAVTLVSTVLALATYCLVERPCLASKVHPKARESAEPQLLPAT
jgi:peptidoglycan/LPS O-acetylase OafA/YrhL